MAEITNSSPQNKGGKVRSRKMSTRIDMTPMVDLAFLLLTFFMLTTTFLKSRVMEVDMPEKSIAAPPPINVKKVLTLVLGANNKVYWYMGYAEPPYKATDFSPGGVRKLLMEKNAQIKGLYVFIKPSDKSRYQNIVDVFDELSIAGVKHFSVTEITEEDNKLIKEINFTSQLTLP